METDALRFYKKYRNHPVTREQLIAAGAEEGENGVWRFRDGSYGGILSNPTEVREHDTPVGATFFAIVEPDDYRVADWKLRI
jgi:hypothetical protein